MLWFVLFFLVVLKIPVLYLAYLIWWAVKDPPRPGAGLEDGLDGFGGGSDWGRGPRHRLRGGPHGSPLRRPARVTASTRSRRAV